jgi:hypothetical protein
MTPEEKFKQEVKNLIEQSGCSVDKAFETALKEFSHLADQADVLRNIKQQIEWDMKFGK